MFATSAGFGVNTACERYVYGHLNLKDDNRTEINAELFLFISIMGFEKKS